MTHLYQPVYEYVKKGFSIRFTHRSTIIYDTEERARLCALDKWPKISDEDDKLLEITIQQLIIG